MANLGTIDNRYVLLSVKLNDIQTTSYVARSNQDNNNYIIEIMNNGIQNPNFPANQVNILNILNQQQNNQYILRYIDQGNDPVTLGNNPPINKDYIVYENAPKLDLFSYLNAGNNHGFGERQAKLIFKKILLGVRVMHNANICHRDLKPGNILFDNDFNPKIYGYHFIHMNANDLNEFMGTINYAAPEILLHNPYNGIKADIFSLGQILFNLVTGRLGFNNANMQDNLYRLIILHQYIEYWERIQENIPLNVSQEFRDLFLSLVAFDPNERSTIDQILNSPWMNEINNLNEQQMNDLENEVRQEFINREQILNQN